MSLASEIGHRASYFWRFAAIWIPLMAVAGIVTWMLYEVQLAAGISVLRAGELSDVQIAVKSVTTKLSGVRSDLLYLSDRNAFQRWFESEDVAIRDEIAADYLAFMARKQRYDQLRLIDVDGRELVRVNWNAGHPAIVPQEELQNKLDRYYVRDGLAVGRGNVYVSPFDLNVEHGEIEQPIKPVIRFATPVFDERGEKRGLIVLNFLGQDIIDDLNYISAQDVGDIWLLNSQGYWLAGGRPDDLWGFMYPQRASRNLAEREPTLWRRIIEGPVRGQAHSDSGLFTYETILLEALGKKTDESVPGETEGDRWYMVAFVPEEIMAARASGLARNFSAAYMALALLFTMVAGFAAYLWGRRAYAERAVRLARLRYEDLVNNLNVGIYRNTIGSEGGFLEVNPAMVQIFAAKDREQLLSARVSDLYVDSALRAEFSRRIMEMGAVVDEELRLRRLSGESFWAAVTAVKKTDPTGEIYFDGVLMDITERKEAEEALRASEARFRGLLEAAPDGVVVSDHEGRIVLVNAQTESLLGYEREELLGESVEVLVPDRVRGGHREDRERYMRDPNKRMMGEGKRLWARRCDGGEVPVSISLSPVHTDGGLLVFSAIRDITEIHQAEERIQSLNEQLARHNRELESVNKELEAFSYSVSHDLRAPLRAIDGFSRILQNELKDVLDPQSSDRMMRIRRAAQRMGELIDDMLKLSRVTRAEMSWQDVDLATLAGEVMDGLRHGDPEREVAFESVPALPVRGDPQLLRIVLENLLGNAWKFTSHRDAGHIELGCEERDGERVIRVRDNGAGFDMSYADKLFGAFQRLHDAREFPGTGIGLATVQRIVHKHGGRVWAEGAVDRGASFYFTLAREQGA